MEKPASYRIIVLGELDQKWSERLGGMNITVDCKENQDSLTTLEGLLRDQAALAGVLSTLYELHLPVRSVECLNT
jgi:hypothetical protein